QALDRGGHVLDAMRALAPWDGRTLVDLGCGTGFWLPRYAAEAAEVIGIEPDSVLLTRAEQRVRHLPSVRVAAGSAEHLGLPARSVDVVHARFAYFFPPNGDAGLTEVLRALRPGGSLVVVDNDYRWGEFATLLAASAPRDGPGTKGRAELTDASGRGGPGAGGPAGPRGAAGGGPGPPPAARSGRPGPSTGAATWTRSCTSS